jgi:hypothetical protein
MKVLIIALPRTGSTSLLYKYAKEYKLMSLFEPYDKTDRCTYVQNMNNVIVKTLIYQIPYGYSNIIDGYVELSKEFDKVILLTRKNLDECAESWAYLKYFNQRDFDSTKNYVWKPVPNLTEHKNDITNWNQCLIKIGEILNIDLVYYEDIFDKNSNERYRKNIKIDKSKLI